MNIDEEIQVLREDIERLCDYRSRCQMKYGAIGEDIMIKNMLRRDRRRLKKLLLLKG